MFQPQSVVTLLIRGPCDERMSDSGVHGLGGACTLSQAQRSTEPWTAAVCWKARDGEKERRETAEEGKGGQEKGEKGEQGGGEEGSGGKRGLLSLRKCLLQVTQII